MPLSPHEQQILDRIEHELHTHDAALAASFRTSPPPGPAPRPVPFWAGQLGVLTLVLGVLVLHPLVLPLETLGIGALTAAMILPWLAHTALSAAKRTRP